MTYEDGAPVLAPRRRRPRFVPMVAVLMVVAIGGGAYVLSAQHGVASEDRIVSMTRPYTSTTQQPVATTVAPLPTVQTPVTAATIPPASGKQTPVNGRPDSGSWVAQLYSVDVTDGPAALDAAFASISADIPGAAVLESNSYASMTPGYWVIYHAGPFDDGYAVIDFCRSRGLSMPSNCLGRLLTPDPDDLTTSQCYIDPNGYATPACDR